MSNAPARVSPQDVIGKILDKYAPVTTKLLAGSGTSEGTFRAQVGNAMRANPDLWACQPETVLGAALRCAQLNLPPNDGNSLAWIIPYSGKATFQLGYGGVLELARRATPGIRFEGRPVYPNDTFDLDYGRPNGQQLQHRPALGNRGGAAVAWYVRATYPVQVYGDGQTTGGGEYVHVLDREGVEHHRSFSKQPNGPMWAKSYDAAALKSVVLDMRRWLPHTPLLAEATAADGSVHDVRDMEQAGAIVHKADEPDALGSGASDGE